MLELRDLGFGYEPGSWIFRHVDLSVELGTVTAVLGPNGHGKTTLVRCAAGLLEPREGEVRRDEPVGFVPQARGSAFAYPVAEMVVMGRLREIGLFSSPGRADRAAAQSAMERTGVAHLRDRRFPTLSGGEQQLVLIARALAAQAPMLVLDEPSTGLDLHNQAQILSLLRTLVADGIGVLMTTHDPGQALLLADSVVLMGGSDGVRTGPAEELLTDGELSRLYSIGIRTVIYEHEGAEHRTMATVYPVEDGRGVEGRST